MGERGRYLYAITRRLDSDALSGTPGLEGGRLEVVDHGDLVAVVSDVDLEEYGEEGLRRNLERLDWLEATARTHDAVIKAVAAQGPTAPLRLATICLDDDGVRRRMDEWHGALRAVLDRIDGRLEMSVKVFASPSQPQPPSPAAETGRVGGAEYLRRKKAATEARRVAEESSLQVGERIYAALAEVSVASRRLPPQDPRLTGHVGTMLLNAAYLVESSEVEAFERMVEEQSQGLSGVGVEVSGPWPPYSFAMLEQS